MSKVLSNEHQRKVLEADPNVAPIFDRSIQYKPEFKVLAVKENLAGKVMVTDITYLPIKS